MPQQLPTTWLGLLALIVALIFPPAVAIWQSKRTREKVGTVQADVTTVKDQVSNGHTTNLRDDISKLLEQGIENAKMTAIVKEYVEKMMPTNKDVLAIHTELSGIVGDIRVLRGELISEREARISLAAIVSKHHPGQK